MVAFFKGPESQVQSSVVMKDLRPWINIFFFFLRKSWNPEFYVKLSNLNPLPLTQKTLNTLQAE